MSKQIADQRDERTKGAEVPPVEDAPLDPNPVIAEGLLKIRSLLERGDMNSAWEVAKELDQRCPGSDRVRHFIHVLAPGKSWVVPGARVRSLQPERAWLREHAHEYPGCWLAVFGDRLIAADRDLRVVLDMVRRTPGAAAALIHFQSGPVK